MGRQRCILGIILLLTLSCFAADRHGNATGVKVDGVEGVFKVQGLGGGQDENATFDFNSTANTVVVGTDTGVTIWDWSTLSFVDVGNIVLADGGTIGNAGGVNPITFISEPPTITIGAATNFGSYSMVSVNIDNGTIDNTAIGGATPAAGAFTGLTIGDLVIGNGTIVDAGGIGFSNTNLSGVGGIGCGDITSVGDILLANNKTIGSASIPALLTLTSTGLVVDGILDAGATTVETLTITDASQDYVFAARSGDGLVVQSQDSGKPIFWEFMTKDGDGTDDVWFQFWGYGTPDVVANSHRAFIGWNTAGRYELKTAAAGNQSVQPLRLYTGSNITQLVLNTDGNVGMGTYTPDTTLQVVGTAGFGDDSSNETLFSATGAQTMVGDARVEKYMTISAGSLTKGASPPGSDLIGTFPVLDFASNTDEEAYYVIHMPADWDSTTDIEVAIYWCPTTSDAGKTVGWEIDWEARAHGAAAAGEILGAGSASSGTDLHDTTYAGANNLQETGYYTISAASLAVDDTVGIKVSRDVSDDNYGADAALVHLEIEYIANKLGEAL